ncbi:MAG TPA: hypothetical protein ENI86_10330 [Acidimicrobiales bacterium]|nr:hypothetical protein [Acidimicrobiales bacterium]
MAEPNRLADRHVPGGPRPGSVPRVIVRQRMVDRLARRWVVPVMLVEAPGGFGKSIAIAQAVEDNRSDPTGIDLVVDCRRAMVDVGALAREILAAAAGSGGPPAPEIEPLIRPALLGRVVAEYLATWSPDAVTLILDDVHLLLSGPPARESSFRTLLSVLASDLPANAHLVLSGRPVGGLEPARPPGVGEVEVLGPAELGFTVEEFRELVMVSGCDERSSADHSIELRKWPAMAAVALAAGGTPAPDRLLDQVVAQMSERDRELITVAALAGTADRELFDEIGIEPPEAEISTRLPLTAIDSEGRLWVHDLWREVIDTMVDRDRLASLLRTVSRRLGDEGRHDECIRLAVRHGFRDTALEALRNAIRWGEVLHTAEPGEQWLSLLGPGGGDEPEIIFLEGIVERLRGNETRGSDLLMRALREGLRTEDSEFVNLAAYECLIAAWARRDLRVISKLIDWELRFNPPGDNPVTITGRAVMSELEGDLRGALEQTRSLLNLRLPNGQMERILRYRMSLALGLGDGDVLVRSCERLADLVPVERNRFSVAVARFHNGDPNDILARYPKIRAPRSGHRIGDIRVESASGMIDAALGVEPAPVTIGQDEENLRIRYQVFAAMPTIAARIVRGDEAGAAHDLDVLLARVGEGPDATEALALYLSYGYVLSRSVRRWFDPLENELGPLQRVRLDLGRLVVAIRNGRVDDWSAYRGPGQVLACLPLPWSVEVAAALCSHDEEAGLELAEFLAAVQRTAGSAVRCELRRLATEGSEPARSGARTLLRRLPVPPADPLEIRVLGRMEVGTPGRTGAIGRKRVQQLLGLLVLRRRVERSQVMEILWPGVDREKSANNLRVTLSYLRDLTEPGRRAGEKSFTIRDDGSSLVLHPGRHVRVDLWDLELLLDEARSLHHRGRIRRAAELRGRAIELWRGQPLVELRDLPAVFPEVLALESRILREAVRLAEWFLSEGSGDRARSLARRILETSPFEMQARYVAIAADLNEGDVREAARGIDAAKAALAEMGVTPDSSLRMLIRRLELRTQSSSA